jgi:membrane protease YdiL (CAAX protease family)
MKHLECALTSQNQWWKYLIIVVAGFVAANLIGAIPLMVVIGVKVAQGVGGPNPDNPMDLSSYGIDPNLGLALMMIPFVIGLLTIVLLFKPLHGRTVWQVINGTNRARWGRFFFAFVIWGILAGLYLLVDYMVNPGNYVMRLNPSSLIPLVIISLILIPIQTSYEEVLFRGYLTQGFASWTHSRWIAIIIPGILFGLMHSMNPEVKEFGFWTAMPQYVIYGFVFGLITVLDDGIELAMGAHAVNNIFNSIFITYKASALQTPAVFEQQVVNPNKETIVLLAISILFTLALAYKYKWSFAVLNRKVVSTEVV